MSLMLGGDSYQRVYTSSIIGALTIIFGLFYIPAFMYGYFWLWVFPFTAIVTLFVRVMIDSAIDQVSRVGDEATQAKAMIPKFIKMNIVMTVLLSIPFLSALWLNELGYIERLQYSDGDRSFFEYFLTIFTKEYMEPKLFTSVTNNPSSQILISNLFFMVTCIMALLVFGFKKIKQLFKILYNKKLYRFLQKKILPGDARLGVITFLIIGLVICMFSSASFILTDQGDFTQLIAFLLFINFYIFLQTAIIIAYFVEYRMRPPTTKKE